MEKFLFARLISLLSSWGLRPLDTYELRDLDTIIVDASCEQVNTLQNEISDLKLRHKPEINTQLVHELLSAIQKGNKIDAIKAYRSMTGWGLKESKDAVEAYWNKTPTTQAIP